MLKLKNLMDAPITVTTKSRSIHFKAKEVIDVTQLDLDSPEVKIKIKRNMLMALQGEVMVPQSKNKIKK